jgi:hypothetical protein
MKTDTPGGGTVEAKRVYGIDGFVYFVVYLLMHGGCMP